MSTLDQPRSTRERRFKEVDALKGIGILAVVLIHSVRPFFHPDVSPVELWISHMTRFAVPAFLLASGLLYATRIPVTWGASWRRVQRVIVPYLVASLGAELFRMSLGEEISAASVVRDLLLGNSFGPFYFVFVFLIFVLICPLLVRLTTPALLMLVAVLIWIQFRLETSFLLEFFWHLRNPLLWAAYFVVGWVVRLHFESLSAWVALRRAPLSVVLAILTLAAAASNPWLDTRFSSGGVGWLGIWLSLSLIWVVAGGLSSTPRALLILSEGSYSIYLYHLFLLTLVERLVPMVGSSFDLPLVSLYWFSGVFGPLALLWVGRRLLGDSRSRFILGG